jgi:hypothetical protein
LFSKYIGLYESIAGRDSVVGMATCYGLDMDILMQWPVDHVLKISAVKLIFEFATVGAVIQLSKTGSNDERTHFENMF